MCDSLRHSTAHVLVPKACACIKCTCAVRSARSPLQSSTCVGSVKMRCHTQQTHKHTTIQTHNHTHHTLVLPCLFLEIWSLFCPNFGFVFYLAATWSGGAVEGLARFAAPSRCCQNASEVRRARRGLCSRFRLQRLGAPSAACGVEPRMKCAKRGPLLD